MLAARTHAARLTLDLDDQLNIILPLSALATGSPDAKRSACASRYFFNSRMKDKAKRAKTNGVRKLSGSDSESQ